MFQWFRLEAYVGKYKGRSTRTGMDFQDKND